MSQPEQLTTAHGAPVGDNQNALTAGRHGPLLLQDDQLLEKMATFNRKRVPERLVLAKGSGAFGSFTMGGPVEDSRSLEPPLKVSGDADHYDHRAGNDEYTQPGNLFRLMNARRTARWTGMPVSPDVRITIWRI